MKITLKLESGEVLTMVEPYSGAGYVIPSEDDTTVQPPEITPCPKCSGPMQVRCPRYSQDDRAMWGKGVCGVCNEHLGAFRVEFDTLFGREEDNRVLNGRPRVYY